MKLNSNLIIRPITASVIATFFLASMSTVALADNKAALKDSIKVAETKTTDIKAADPMAKPMADEDFKKLDSNRDEKISLKEAVKDKALATKFDATDANHDGMISTDEYANYKVGLSAKAPDVAPAAPVN